MPNTGANVTKFFFELATTLKNLGAKWLSEKKINFTPCKSELHFQNFHVNF